MEKHPTVLLGAFSLEIPTFASQKQQFQAKIPCFQLFPAEIAKLFLVKSLKVCQKTKQFPKKSTLGGQRWVFGHFFEI